MGAQRGNAVPIDPHAQSAFLCERKHMAALDAHEIGARMVFFKDEIARTARAGFEEPHRSQPRFLRSVPLNQTTGVSLQLGRCVAWSRAIADHTRIMGRAQHSAITFRGAASRSRHTMHDLFVSDS